jgi:hypothetical protein
MSFSARGRETHCFRLHFAESQSPLINNPERWDGGYETRWGEQGDSAAALTMQKQSLYLTPGWSAIRK